MVGVDINYKNKTDPIQCIFNTKISITYKTQIVYLFLI